MDYVIVIERAADGTYSAYVPDLSGCVSTGDTLEELKANIAEAVQGHIECLRSGSAHAGTVHADVDRPRRLIAGVDSYLTPHPQTPLDNRDMTPGTSRRGNRHRRRGSGGELHSAFSRCIVSTIARPWSSTCWPACTPLGRVAERQPRASRSRIHTRVDDVVVEQDDVVRREFLHLLLGLFLRLRFRRRTRGRQPSMHPPPWARPAASSSWA